VDASRAVRIHDDDPPVTVLRSPRESLIANPPAKREEGDELTTRLYKKRARVSRAGVMNVHKEGVRLVRIRLNKPITVF
jgi:hypothetical protein